MKAHFWTVFCWITIAVLGAAVAVGVDMVIALVLFPYLPDSWDLTGSFFLFTVPLAQAIVMLPALGVGSLVGIFTPLRLLWFGAAYVACSAYMLTSFKNPTADIIQYQISFGVLLGLVLLLSWQLTPPRQAT